jgi:hypothetical protein
VLYLDRSGYITRNHSVPEIPQLATTYGELATLGAIRMFDHVSRLSPSKRITAASSEFSTSEAELGRWCLPLPCSQLRVRRA